MAFWGYSMQRLGHSAPVPPWPAARWPRRLAPEAAEAHRCGPLLAPAQAPPCCCGTHPPGGVLSSRCSLAPGVPQLIPCILIPTSSKSLARTPRPPSFERHATTRGSLTLGNRGGRALRAGALLLGAPPAARRPAHKLPDQRTSNMLIIVWIGDADRPDRWDPQRAPVRAQHEAGQPLEAAMHQLQLRRRRKCTCKATLRCCESSAPVYQHLLHDASRPGSCKERPRYRESSATVMQPLQCGTGCQLDMPGTRLTVHVSVADPGHACRPANNRTAGAPNAMAAPVPAPSCAQHSRLSRPAQGQPRPATASPTAPPTCRRVLRRPGAQALRRACGTRPPAPPAPAPPARPAAGPPHWGPPARCRPG
jgi:hypothetical protein